MVQQHDTQTLLAARDI